MSHLLQALKINKIYGNNNVLDNVNVYVRSGECLAILGDNGSGKSTLMAIIAGMDEKYNGTILLDGEKISRKNRLNISFVPQEAVLTEDLSVKDNLKLWASVYKISFSLALKNIPEFLNINEFMNKKVSELSGGMKKKVAISVALMNNPKFLILDEAFASLDAKTVQNMITYLKTLENVGIIYSSHNEYEIEELCTRKFYL